MTSVMRVRAELTPEEKEKAMIERKRAADEARRQRILDVRTRTMGLDTDFLKQQIAEKQQIANAEREREEVLDQRVLENANRAELINREVQKIRKQEEYRVKQFQMKNQDKSSRREFDLSDPERLKKSKNPLDEPEKLGPSSFQIFDGTDPNAADRKKREAEQLRSWYQTGSEERQLGKSAEKNQNIEFSKIQTQVDERLQEVHSAVEQMRLQKRVNNQAENKNLASMRAKKMDDDKANEIQANLQEIETQLNSPFLSEDKQTTVNFFDPRRPVPYHFKGFSDSSKQHILDTQVSQAEEKKLTEQAIAQNEKDWADYMEHQRVTGLKIEREVQRIKMQQRVDHREELLRQAKSQTEQITMKNKSFTTNKIDPSFFDQFGNSCR